MNQPASTFPGHKFDFGDAVYIAATQTGGSVEGIHKTENSWSYYISGHGEQWWYEDQLERACSRCFGPWSNVGRCPHCGFSYSS